jgi:1-acyl-sn-glycerol-3-phosphate acyltransferase
MAWFKGSLAALFIGVNTIAGCILLFIMALIRLPLTGRWHAAMSKHMDLIIDGWVSANRLMYRTLRLIDVQVSWPTAELSRRRWYMVVSNHQTWVDIVLLQSTLRPVIPPLKFFTKQQLIWLPFLGQAMYLLGFPYVRRVSRQAQEANPGLKHLDRQNTLAACDRFRTYPTAVLNFLEGTRFTIDKHAAQNARYQNLLNPRIGGLSYVLSGLADELNELIDVSIVYPNGAPGFWEFLQGKCDSVTIKIELHQLSPSMQSTDLGEQRKSLGPFIESLWQAKDDLINLTKPPTASG